MKTNWQIKNLGEVLKLEYGKPLPDTKRKPNGKYPVYGANGEINRTDEFYYNKPSIIVGRKGSAGEINLTENKFWPLDVTFFVTFNDKEYDLKFIYNLLSKLELQKHAKGVKPGINRNEIYDIQIPLPPLSEQKRIVAILDKAFAAIDKARTNAEKNLASAREVFDSYLNSVFSSKGVGWEEKKLVEVCKEIFAGGDAPKDNFSNEKNEKFTIPIFANAVKNNGLYGYTNTARVNEPAVTVAARGSGTGHTEIRHEPFLPIVRLIVLLPNLAMIHLEFLKHIIDNLEIKRSGSAIPQLTVPMICEHKIFVPSLTEQKQIISKLDHLAIQTKRLEEIYKQKIANLDELKKSILQKAFEGELA